jgi:uncharacterized protein YhfF
MPTQRRHGLTTVLLTGDPDVRGALTDHLLAGRKTVVLRPVTEPDREPLERAGDRVLLVDSAGHSIAVADVVSADLTTLAGVDEDTRRADDPDHVGTQWASAQLARWRAAGLIAPTVLTDPTVLVIRVRVVGLENPSKTADIEGMQR